MKLSLKTQFRSIKKFPVVEIPDVSVIVGVNGAGKSQLLHSISTGSVKVDGIGPEQIALFTWETLVPGQSEQVDAATERRRRESGLIEIESIKEGWSPRVKELAKKHGLSALLADPYSVLLGNNSVVVDAYRGELADLIRRMVENYHGDSGVKQFMKTVGPQFAALDRDELGRRLMRFSPQMFASPISRVFNAYHNELTGNRLRKLAKQEGRDEGEVLSDDDFVRRFGKAPWDHLNNSMKRIGLPFTVDHPVGYLVETYAARLTKSFTGDVVDFPSLSSGEKVLMSLALAAYGIENGSLSKVADLVLFDEVDSVLHPSMSRSLMGVINSLSEFGVKVIAATHSPSTIAVSPEESIFLMTPDGAGLQKFLSRKQLQC